MLVQTYAATFAAYRDQTIEYRPLRMQPDDTEVVVKSLINQPGGKPVNVDYKMEKGASGLEGIRRGSGGPEPGAELPRHLRDAKCARAASTG